MALQNPINYASMVGGFMSPEEAFVQSLKYQQLYEKEQNARRMNADLQDYLGSPDPQKLAGLYLRYPALKESLGLYTQTLADADKNTTLEFATKAFALNRAGRTEDVMGLFDTYIRAAEESGRPDMARVLKDSRETYQRIDDPATREALIGAAMAGAGEEGIKLYEKIWSGPKPEMTSFQKDLQAAGIDPESPEGKARAREFVQNKVDPIVQMETPQGRQFIGPQSVYLQRYSGGAKPGEPLPRPKSRAEYDALPSGTNFLAPDGSVRKKP